MASQYAFGSGTVYAKSSTIPNATPYEFGALQGIQLDFSFTTKSLYGQYSYALAVGRGTAKMTGKASFGKFNAAAFNDFFLGNPTGVKNYGTAVRTSQDEVQTVITKNINVTHNTNFLKDLGVVYQANGVPLIKVTGTANGDQYTVNESTGFYSFDASNNGGNMLISYTYQPSANQAPGTYSVPWTNQLIGVAPEFSLVCHQTFNGQDLTYIFNSVISSKLSLATKLEDFTMPDFDFEIKADASNTIGSLNYDA